MREPPSVWTLVGIYVPIVVLSVCLFFMWSALKTAKADIERLTKKQEITTEMLEGFAKGVYNLEAILNRIEEQGR